MFNMLLSSETTDLDKDNSSHQAVGDSFPMKKKGEKLEREKTISCDSIPVTLHNRAAGA